MSSTDPNYSCAFLPNFIHIASPECPATFYADFLIVAIWVMWPFLPMIFIYMAGSKIENESKHMSLCDWMEEIYSFFGWSVIYFGLGFVAGILWAVTTSVFVLVILAVIITKVFGIKFSPFSPENESGTPSEKKPLDKIVIDEKHIVRDTSVGSTYGKG
jgi:hypothetical protein